MTKDEAQAEALRRWHDLPDEERQTPMHAQVLAAALAEELDFHTMANSRKIIAAWIIQGMKGAPEDVEEADDFVGPPAPRPSRH
jgi:hypothetical protein